MAQIDELKQLKLRLQQYNYKPEFKKLDFPKEFYIKEVNTDSLEHHLSHLVNGLLQLEEGKSHPLKSIQEGINYVFGTQFFKKVDFSFSTDSVGTILNIEAIEASPTIQVGMHYSLSLIHI